jgi:NAD-dependent SIR2 family protein deacetylase
MRFECGGCKKSFSGSGLTVSKHGKEQMYCADCYWKLQKEYDQKKTCEDCGSFDDESCQKTGKKLSPAKVGFNTYFVEAETCKNYSTEKKGTSKKKDKELTDAQKEAAALIKTLTAKGKTLTYYCCHCGAPMKIGAKSPEIQKNCPRCQGDLEIIDLSKFIKQHQS